jgi:tRNA(Leu) C34 or U34 (ribose-2'-O)-methylase TrmL
VFFSKHAKYGSTPLGQHVFPQPPSHPPPGDVHDVALMFGNEVQGIDFVPEEVVEAHARVFLPMGPGIRSYNLSNVVAVGVFEAVRQVPSLYRGDDLRIPRCADAVGGGVAD